jgi:hypothetical protein
MPARDRTTSGRKNGTANPARDSQSEPEADAKDPRVPLTLRVPASSAVKLKLHSLAEGKSASDIVAGLIEANLNKYSILTVPTKED